MTLLEKQQEFALQAAHLIIYAHSIGKPLKLGDAFRDPRVHGEFGTKKGYGAASSVHKLGLAIDLPLILNGKFATPAEYKELHDYFDGRGGAKRIDNDMNHFSFEHNGFR